jgi:hypothetical protein
MFVLIDICESAPVSRRELESNSVASCLITTIPLNWQFFSSQNTVMISMKSVFHLQHIMARDINTPTRVGAVASAKSPP